MPCASWHGPGQGKYENLPFIDGKTGTTLPGSPPGFWLSSPRRGLRSSRFCPVSGSCGSGTTPEHKAGPPMAQNETVSTGYHRGSIEHDPGICAILRHAGSENPNTFHALVSSAGEPPGTAHFYRRSTPSPLTPHERAATMAERTASPGLSHTHRLAGMFWHSPLGGHSAACRGF